MKNIKPKYQKYPEYKDSDVEWLGEIPKHWEVKKVSHLFNEIGSGTTPTSGDLRYYDGPYNFLQTGDLNDGKIFKTKKSIKERALKDFSSLKLYPKGSLIIAMYGATIGKLGILEVEAATNQACCVFKKSNKIVTEYFFYVLLGFRSDIISLSYGGGQPNISQDLIKSLRLPIAPLPEQTAIANFLDDKTAKIDRAIAQKEKLIALLKERKQIIIQNAVTKGLNPNVKLKDSGVEWIGKIPEHWEVKRFRYIFNLDKGLTITKENLIDEGIPCVNYGEIHSKYGFEVNPDIHDLKCVEKEYSFISPSSLLKKGDFVFADTSEDIEGSGNFTYLNSDKETFAGYHTIIAKPKIKLFARFLAYAFDSLPFRNQIRSSVKGVKVFSITQTILKELFVWLPPIDEQKQISSYLDNQSVKIDKAISLQQKQIEKLKEYKTVLIDNAVTGKIKVS